MITGKIEAHIDPILFYIDKLISIGMQNSAEVLAKKLRDEAQEILTAQISASGGTESGNLSEAISARRMDTGLANYAQAELIVDTNRAPYAEWVERGRFAASVPYENVGGRNYRDSKFVGHHYLGKALNKIKRIASETVLRGILGTLSNPLRTDEVIKMR